MQVSEASLVNGLCVCNCDDSTAEVYVKVCVCCLYSSFMISSPD